MRAKCRVTYAFVHTGATNNKINQSLYRVLSVTLPMLKIRTTKLPVCMSALTMMTMLYGLRCMIA